MLDRFLAWLKPDSERRSVQRRSGVGLWAFFWEGDVPRAHRVKDISKHGAYIETDSLSWTRGTLMMLTLQFGSDMDPGHNPQDATTVPAEVVRASASGMALRFLFQGMD